MKKLYFLQIKKSRYVLCYLLVIILSTLNLKAQFASGTGTQADPYIITTTAHLEYLSTMMTSSPANWSVNKYFRLDADVVMSPTISSIGDFSRRFQGYFDGNNNSITASGKVPFSVVESATIVNLTINGSVNDIIYYQGYNEIGGIVGRMVNNNFMSNCINNASVTNNTLGNGTGGVVGFADNNNTIVNCINNGTIVVGTNSFVGGIAGSVSSGTTISNCINNGSITDNACSVVGGIVGSVGITTISNCINNGTITSTNTTMSYITCVSGIVGIIYSNTIIDECFSDCNINVNMHNISVSSIPIYVGGIIGRNYSNIEIEPTTSSSGNIEIVSTGDVIIHCGGIIGYNDVSTITSGFLKKISSDINIEVESDNYAYVGGIIGTWHPTNVNIVIDSCEFNGFIDVTADIEAHVGGIVGQYYGPNNYNASTPYNVINNSTNYGDINAHAGKVFSGGIVGYIFKDDFGIVSCNNYGNLHSSSDISGGLCHTGGILGDVNNFTNLGLGRIFNCTNAGRITSSGDCGHFDLAGIAGDNMGPLYVNNCVNIGTIKSHAAGTCGGIVGYGNETHILNCHNSGFVSGTSSVSGIIGAITEGSITQNLNCGVVYASGNGKGGIVGTRNALTTLQNNFYDKQMCIYGGVNSLDITANNAAVGRLTDSVISSNLQTYLGNINFTYTANLYPKVIGVTDDGLNNVAASPAYLYHTNAVYDEQDSVMHNFTVNTSNNVIWSRQIGNVNVTGSDVTIVTLGWDTLHASIDNLVREVPIQIVEADSVNLVTKPSDNDAGNTTGTGKYLQGDTAVTITAIPAPCYSFVRWVDSATGNTKSTNAIDTVWMTHSKTLIAEFEQDSADITLIINSGSGTVQGYGTYPCPYQPVNILAIPDPCYKFVSWTDAAGNIIITAEDAGPTGMLTIDMIGDSTLYANFEMDSSMLSLSVQPVGAGIVSNSGKYLCEDTVNISATPNDCYRFIRWIDNETNLEFSTKSNDTVIMNGDRSLTAIFEPDSFMLVTKTNPSYAGKTTGGGRYKCDTMVTFSATPNNACYQFINWTDSATGLVYSNSEIDSIDVLQNKTLIANFSSKDTFNLELYYTPDDIYSIYLGGASAYSSCDSIVTISAIANSECVRFIAWTDAAGNTKSLDATTTIQLSSDSLLIAHFEQDTFLLSLTVNDTNAGTVFNQIELQREYSCDYPAPIEAKAKAGWKFVNWTFDNGNIYSDNYQDVIQMNNNYKLIANFRKSLDSFNLKLIPNPTAGGTAITSGRYEMDEVIQIVAIANPNYRFVNWTDSATGVQISNKEVVNFTLKRNTTLYANFTDINETKYLLSLSSNPEWIGNLTGGGLYDANSKVVINAVPTDDATFINWTDSAGKIISSNPNHTITINSDTNLIANFDLPVYTVTATSNGIFGGSVTGSGWYIANSEAQITAISNDDYIFMGWTSYNNLDDTLSKDSTWKFIVTRDTSVIGHFVNESKINEILANNFQIIPNPVTTNLLLTFDLQESGNLTITLVNLFGQEINQLYNNFTEAGTFTKMFSLEPEALSQGTYYLKIMHNEKLQVEKLIITK